MDPGLTQLRVCQTSQGEKQLTCDTQQTAGVCQGGANFDGKSGSLLSFYLLVPLCTRAPLPGAGKTLVTKSGAAWVSVSLAIRFLAETASGKPRSHPGGRASREKILVSTCLTAPGLEARTDVGQMGGPGGQTQVDVKAHAISSSCRSVAH